MRGINSASVVAYPYVIGRWSNFVARRLIGLIVSLHDMPSSDFSADLNTLAGRAKALSHPARLAVIRHLAAHDECICGDIVESLPLAQSTVSRHLKVLQEAGVIRVTQDGPRSCYCLDRAVLEEIRRSFDVFLDTPAQPAAEHA